MPADILLRMFSVIPIRTEPSSEALHLDVLVIKNNLLAVFLPQFESHEAFLPVLPEGVLGFGLGSNF